jgi:hypothetical protein
LREQLRQPRACTGSAEHEVGVLGCSHAVAELDFARCSRANVKDVVAAAEISTTLPILPFGPLK